MSKSRKNVRRSRKYNGFFNKMKTTSKNMIPVVKSGLNKVGNTVKNVAVKSKPVIKDSLAKIYSYVETGIKYTNSAFKKSKRSTRKKYMSHKKK